MSLIDDLQKRQDFLKAQISGEPLVAIPPTQTLAATEAKKSTAPVVKQSSIIDDLQRRQDYLVAQATGKPIITSNLSPVKPDTTKQQYILGRPISNDLSPKPIIQLTDKEKLAAQEKAKADAEAKGLIYVPNKSDLTSEQLAISNYLKKQETISDVKARLHNAATPLISTGKGILSFVKSIPDIANLAFTKAGAGEEIKKLVDLQGLSNSLQNANDYLDTLYSPEVKNFKNEEFSFSKIANDPVMFLSTDITEQLPTLYAYAVTGSGVAGTLSKVLKGLGKAAPIAEAILGGTFIKGVESVQNAADTFTQILKDTNNTNEALKSADNVFKDSMKTLATEPIQFAVDFMLGGKGGMLTRAAKIGISSLLEIPEEIVQSKSQLDEQRRIEGLSEMTYTEYLQSPEGKQTAAIAGILGAGGNISSAVYTNLGKSAGLVGDTEEYQAAQDNLSGADKTNFNNGYKEGEKKNKEQNKNINLKDVEQLKIDINDISNTPIPLQTETPIIQDTVQTETPIIQDTVQTETPIIQQTAQQTRAENNIVNQELDRSSTTKFQTTAQLALETKFPNATIETFSGKTSSGSKTKYIRLTEGDNSTLIRISDHKLPKTYQDKYGKPDFEIDISSKDKLNINNIRKALQTGKAPTQIQNFTQSDNLTFFNRNKDKLTDAEVVSFIDDRGSPQYQDTIQAELDRRGISDTQMIELADTAPSVREVRNRVAPQVQTQQADTITQSNETPIVDSITPITKSSWSFKSIFTGNQVVNFGIRGVASTLQYASQLPTYGGGITSIHNTLGNITGRFMTAAKLLYDIIDGNGVSVADHIESIAGNRGAERQSYVSQVKNFIDELSSRRQEIEDDYRNIYANLDEILKNPAYNREDGSIELGEKSKLAIRNNFISPVYEGHSRLGGLFLSGEQIDTVSKFAAIENLASYYPQIISPTGKYKIANYGTLDSNIVNGIYSSIGKDLVGKGILREEKLNEDYERFVVFSTNYKLFTDQKISDDMKNIIQKYGSIEDAIFAIENDIEPLNKTQKEEFKRLSNQLKTSIEKSKGGDAFDPLRLKSQIFQVLDYIKQGTESIYRNNVKNLLEDVDKYTGGAILSEQNKRSLGPVSAVFFPNVYNITSGDAKEINSIYSQDGNDPIKITNEMRKRGVLKNSVAYGAMGLWSAKTIVQGISMSLFNYSPNIVLYGDNPLVRHTDKSREFMAVFNLSDRQHITNEGTEQLKNDLIKERNIRLFTNTGVASAVVDTSSALWKTASKIGYAGPIENFLKETAVISNLRSRLKKAGIDIGKTTDSAIDAFYKLYNNPETRQQANDILISVRKNTNGIGSKLLQSHAVKFLNDGEWQLFTRFPARLSGKRTIDFDNAVSIIKDIATGNAKGIAQRYDIKNTLKGPAASAVFTAGMMGLIYAGLLKLDFGDDDQDKEKDPQTVFDASVTLTEKFLGGSMDSTIMSALTRTNTSIGLTLNAALNGLKMMMGQQDLAGRKFIEMIPNVDFVIDIIHTINNDSVVKMTSSGNVQEVVQYNWQYFLTKWGRLGLTPYEKGEIYTNAISGSPIENLYRDFFADVMDNIFGSANYNFIKAGEIVSMIPVVRNIYKYFGGNTDNTAYNQKKAENYRQVNNVYTFAEKFEGTLDEAMQVLIQSEYVSNGVLEKTFAENKKDNIAIAQFTDAMLKATDATILITPEDRADWQKFWKKLKDNKYDLGQFMTLVISASKMPEKDSLDPNIIKTAKAAEIKSDTYDSLGRITKSNMFANYGVDIVYNAMDGLLQDARNKNIDTIRTELTRIEALMNIASKSPQISTEVLRGMKYAIGQEVESRIGELYKNIKAKGVKPIEEFPLTTEALGILVEERSDGFTLEKTNPFEFDLLSNLTSKGLSSKEIKNKVDSARENTPQILEPSGDTNAFVGTSVKQIGVVTGFGSPLWAEGVDIANKVGTPIFSPTSGTVISAKYVNGWGNQVRIKDINGNILQFSHLNNFNVKEGDYVDAGVQFAAMGDTGNVITGGRFLPDSEYGRAEKDRLRSEGKLSGSHLDFTIYVKGKPVSAQQAYDYWVNAGDVTFKPTKLASTTNLPKNFQISSGGVANTSPGLLYELPGMSPTKDTAYNDEILASVIGNAIDWDKLDFGALGAKLKAEDAKKKSGKIKDLIKLPKTKSILSQFIESQDTLGPTLT